MKLAIFWFRRDLRLTDNKALQLAWQSGYSVLPIFIFDENILQELPKNDARVQFIHLCLNKIQQLLKEHGSSLLCFKGKPKEVWEKLLSEHEISAVFTNKDYEPYGIQRDQEIANLLSAKNIPFYKAKDHVIFEENEVLKPDGTPYTVYTPYKNKWLSQFKPLEHLPNDKIEWAAFYKKIFPFPSLQEIGFEVSSIQVRDYDLSQISSYSEERDFPAKDSTSYLSPHLRFGTISSRQIIAQLGEKDDVFLSELIWREFFIQILYHFPHVVQQSFKNQYDNIKWRNNEREFEAWCKGQTGYALVDAGMRQLNATGYMHNRVRMVVASFLCKHLLIDWRWGEAYFAEKLLDFELASNNGNWQWAAGTGCDAAPYFRVFNPQTQLEKFDKNLKYTRKWVPEYGTMNYTMPLVEHSMAINRALETYKAGLI